MYLITFHSLLLSIKNRGREGLYLTDNNPFLVVLLGNFNAKSSNWCKNDITTNKGKATENFSSQFGIHQVLSEPTHILESSFSCIDLIFTSQPNLINLRPYFLDVSGTSKIQILILSDEQLICLNGTELFLVQSIGTKLF